MFTIATEGPKRHCMGRLLLIFKEDIASGRVGRCNQKRRTAMNLNPPDVSRFRNGHLSEPSRARPSFPLAASRRIRSRRRRSSRRKAYVRHRCRPHDTHPKCRLRNSSAGQRLRPASRALRGLLACPSANVGEPPRRRLHPKCGRRRPEAGAHQTDEFRSRREIALN